jgi:predicted nucleotidyltransferase
MSSELTTIQQCIADTPDVLFAVLVGSRANGTQTDRSDWDIAIQWQTGPMLERINSHEMLRHCIAQRLSVPDEKIDLIDLSSTRMAMQALVVEEGQLIQANDELAWAKYQVRVWRELEHYYWEKTHAA